MSGSGFVPVRSNQELELIRRSGSITGRALKKVLESAIPGISLIELDKIAEEEILRLGGGSSFKTIPGYKWATCLTVNDEVVHGIPRQIKLAAGDVLGIDLGAVYQGWHTDVSWSVLVKNQKSRIKNQREKEKFLEIGERALWKAIGQVKEGKRLGNVSSAIQETIEGVGYSVVQDYVGHGIGRSPHEEPEIHGVGEPGTGIKLKKGMTLAIEVIYTRGGDRVVTASDGWTVVSADGSLGGLFEMTVIVGKKQAEVVTDWRELDFNMTQL